MKTKLLVLILVFTGILSCNSQDSKTPKKNTGKNEPHEAYKVNKKYDDQGRLIEFDSTYTRYYSSYKGDTLRFDSIMQDFDAFFNDHMFVFKPGDIVVRDSTFHHDFFRDDFFEQKFYHQDELMLKMMREMDSLKNEFFQMHSQGIKSL
jgi:hypothetical protein